MTSALARSLPSLVESNRNHKLSNKARKVVTYKKDQPRKKIYKKKKKKSKGEGLEGDEPGCR